MSSPEDVSIIESSGNVFLDLEVADPEEALVKTKLARAISTIIAQRHLSQIQAAELLGTDQPKVSALTRGHLTGFSIDRLLRFLLALDRDVEIIITPKPGARKRARVSIVAGE